MMFKKCIVLVSLVIMFAAPAFAEKGNNAQEITLKNHEMVMAKIKSIDAATLKEWIDGNKDFILLDVRGNDEINAAQIEADQTIEIPRGVIEFKFPQMVPDKETVVVVFCSHGMRSAAVTNTISAYGYKNIYNLKDGLYSWIGSGYRVANFYGTFEMEKFQSKY